MRFAALVLLCFVASACAVFPAPNVVSNTPAPLALAATSTSVPTAPPSSTATNAPSATRAPSPQPTNTAVPTLTRTPSLSVTPTRSVPSVLAQFKLSDLPGEGRDPYAMALLGQTLYVSNENTNNLALVTNGNVSQFMPLESHASALVADATNNLIYAVTYETPTLLVIQNDKIIKQAPLDDAVSTMALDGGTLYVGLSNRATIERYDAATLTKKDELKLSQGYGINDLVVDAPRQRLYAAAYEKVIAIDLASFNELNTLNIPYLYSQFAVSPADGSVWGGGYDEKTSRSYLVGLTPEGQEIARLTIGADLQAATFDEAGRLFVLDHFNNKVYVVQTSQPQLLATIPVNNAPSYAVFDGANHRVFVANSNDDNLAVIDTQSLRVAQVIPLAFDITALAASPKHNRIYAANGSTNSVFVIQNNVAISEVDTGIHPVDLAIDPVSNRLYVASDADGMLTVIDEDSLQVTASQFITRTLYTVAVDSENKKLFAGSVLLDPATLKPVTTFFAQGIPLNSTAPPYFERANPATKMLYALASNGVPGSNARTTLYRFAYDDLGKSQMLGSKNNGNTTALVIDSSTNALFAASTHPLQYSVGLDELDAQANPVRSIPLLYETSALAVNPMTSHLFLAHPEPDYAPPDIATAGINTVEILDTHTLGHVAYVPVAANPQRVTVLGNEVYVASKQDGAITVIGDAVTAQPPAPTPTATPTNYSYVSPSPALPTRTLEANVAPQCGQNLAADYYVKWKDLQNLLGCPAGESTDKRFAVQTFRGAYMFDDLSNPQAQEIYVLFPDHTYAMFDDTWHEGEPEQECPHVPIPQGRIRPKRGFGKLWCENIAVQEELPGAVANEAGVTLTVQPFGHGVMWANTPQGVITLFDNGTWK